jgi:hypothetical protein
LTLSKFEALAYSHRQEKQTHSASLLSDTLAALQVLELALLEKSDRAAKEVGAIHACFSIQKATLFVSLQGNARFTTDFAKSAWRSHAKDRIERLLKSAAGQSTATTDYRAT